MNGSLILRVHKRKGGRKDLFDYNPHHNSGKTYLKNVFVVAEIYNDLLLKFTKNLSQEVSRRTGTSKHVITGDYKNL